MNVIKRDGRRESVKFDKILARIEKMSYGLNQTHINTFQIAQKVIAGLFDGITTIQVDELASEIAASMITHHPDYTFLASRIAVGTLHKQTAKSFSSTMKYLYQNIDLTPSPG